MRTEEEVRLGGWSPSALALTLAQLPLRHLRAPTGSRDAQGKVGPVFSHLSLLAARWFSGEMTSQFLLGLP